MEDVILPMTDLLCAWASWMRIAAAQVEWLEAPKILWFFPFPGGLFPPKMISLC